MLVFELALITALAGQAARASRSTVRIKLSSSRRRPAFISFIKQVNGQFITCPLSFYHYWFVFLSALSLTTAEPPIPLQHLGFRFGLPKLSCEA